MYNHKKEALEQLQSTITRKNEAADFDPIEMSESFQLQLARLSSREIAAVHATPSWL